MNKKYIRSISILFLIVCFLLSGCKLNISTDEVLKKIEKTLTIPEMCNDGGNGICQVKPATTEKNNSEGPGYALYERVCWGYDGRNCNNQHGDLYKLCTGYKGHVIGPTSIDEQYHWFEKCEKAAPQDIATTPIIQSPALPSPNPKKEPSIPSQPPYPILPMPIQQCDLQCEKYHFGNCPKGCIQRCVSSGCSGNICTSDCNGPGSCQCP